MQAKASLCSVHERLSARSTVAGLRLWHAVVFELLGWGLSGHAWATQASSRSLPRGILVFVAPVKGREQSEENSRAIYSLRTPSLTQAVLRKPGPGFVSLSSVSPDAKKIAFYWNSPNTVFFGTPADLRVLDTSTKRETTILHGSPVPTLWSPDGRILCVGPLTGEDEGLFLDLESSRMWRWKPRLPGSAKGRRATSFDLDRAVFTNRGIVWGERLGQAHQLSYLLFHWKNPTEILVPKAEILREFSISPDLSKSADIDNTPVLNIRPFSGDQVRSLNSRMDLRHYPAWSPDSRWVAMAAASKRTYTFIAIDVNSGQAVPLGKFFPVFPGASWLPLKAESAGNILADIESALGPGEALNLPIDCERESHPDEDWSNYKPIGPCPWPLKPTAKKKP